MIITHFLRSIDSGDFETAIQLVLIAKGADPASLEDFSKTCGDKFRHGFCIDFWNSLDCDLREGSQLMPVDMTPSEFLSDVRANWPLTWPYHWLDLDAEERTVTFGFRESKSMTDQDIDEAMARILKRRGLVN